MKLLAPFLIGSLIIASSYMLRFGLTQEEHKVLWITSSVIALFGTFFYAVDRNIG